MILFNSLISSTKAANFISLSSSLFLFRSSFAVFKLAAIAAFCPRPVPRDDILLGEAAEGEATEAFEVESTFPVMAAGDFWVQVYESCIQT